MAEFLDMGKHAVFIWAAYGFSALSLVVLAARSRARQKSSETQVVAARARRKEQV